MSDLALYVASSALIKYLMGLKATSISKDGRPANARKVGTVKGVYIYPLKSARGVEVTADSVTCTDYGFQYKGAMDRQWMVMNTDDQGAVSGRDCPKLVRIIPTILQDSLQLNCEGLPTLTLPTKVPKDTKRCKVNFYGELCECVDCGDEAASWVRKAVKNEDAPYRLVYHPTNVLTRQTKKGQTAWQKEMGDKPKVQFQDMFTYMFLSSASGRDLNERLAVKYGKGEYDIPMMQMRPNIEVEGTQAYAENTWREVYIGESARFLAGAPCGRCRFTAVKQSEGSYDKRLEPLTTLKQYSPFTARFSFGKWKNVSAPIFGWHFVLDRDGQVHVGDPVYAVC